MATRSISVRVEGDLYTALKRQAQARNLNFSDNIRDLLRRAVGIVGSEEEAGFRHGRYEAHRHFRQTVGKALRTAVDGLEIGDGD